MNNQINLNSETSIYAELLANSEKLVSEHERIYYEKKEIPKPPPELINKPNLSEHINDKISDIVQVQPDILPARIPTPKLITPKPPTPKPQSIILEKNNETITAKIAENELLRKKLHLLRELEKMSAKGVKLRQTYTINSDLADIEFEYNLHKDEGSKQNSIKLMGSALLIVVNLLQMANDQYNPFDFKLDGWQDCIVSDMDNYYDVFGEIYDKHYKVGSSSPPEMRLLMLLISSMMALQMKKCMNNFMAPMMGNKQQEKPSIEEQFKKFVKKEQTKNNKLVEEEIKDMECINKGKQEYEKITQNAKSLKDKLLLSTEKNDDDISMSSKSTKSVISFNPNLDNILNSTSVIRHDEISLGKSLSSKKKKN